MNNYTNLDDHPTLEKMADMVVLNVKHEFSSDELKQEADMLAQCVSDKQQEENNKKVAMSVFKNKIDTLQGEINLHASNINHGFTYVDKASVMYRDFDKQKRVYFDKQNGDFLKDEPFHPSDFQKKLDFEEQERARQEQIEFNNSNGDFAEKPTPKDNLGEHYGRDFEPEDALDAVIETKKKGTKKHKPHAEDFLVGDGLTRDRHGNLTDIPSDLPEDPFEAVDDSDLPTE
jgi:hypothetical protein